MNILTFTSLFPNAERPAHGIFIWQRVEHLGRLGNTVEVVAPVPYCPGWAWRSEWRRHARVPKEELVGSLPVRHPRYLLAPRISMPVHGFSMYLGSLPVVRQLHRTVGFDCIDAHYVYPDGFAAVLLGRALGIPVFVSARGSDVNVFSSFALIRPIIQYTLGHAAGVIAVSKAMRNQVIELGCHPEKTCAIGNGVDAERFAPVDRKDCRRRLGIPEDAEVIVSVGALIESKGHHITVAALARLLPQHPRLRLYIIGEGPLRNELMQLAAEHRISDRVQCIGPVRNEQLREWYSAADTSCLFSAREGWPNVLLESLACGTPVVATCVGGIPEIIVNDGLGLMVADTIDAAAYGLHQSLGRDWDRTALVAYAAQHQWRSVAEAVQRFFLETLNATKTIAATAK